MIAFCPGLRLGGNLAVVQCRFLDGLADVVLEDEGADLIALLDKLVFRWIASSCELKDMEGLRVMWPVAVDNRDVSVIARSELVSLSDLGLQVSVRTRGGRRRCC